MLFTTDSELDLFLQKVFTKINQRRLDKNEAIFYHRLFSKTVNSIDSHFCTSVIFTVTANNKVDQIFLIKITSPPLTCTLQALAFFKKTDEKKLKLL